MKKFFSFFFYLMILPFVPAEAASSQRVFLVLWNGCEEACRGFSEYLKSTHEDIEIIQRDLDGQTDKIPDVIAEIKNAAPDLLVTWGTLPTLKILGTGNGNFVSKYGTIPALFMVVSQPVESGLVPSLVSQGRNITGVMHLVPLAEQLQSARQVVAFKRLGIVYNPAETNAQATVDQLRQYAALMNFELLEHPLTLSANRQPSATGIAPAVAGLADKKADVIYLAPDAFMNANRKTLIDTATAFSIPVFSASEGAVRYDNALFAFVHRYYTVGQMAGRKALKILKDKVQAYDIPIEAPQRPLFVVNMTAAQKTGVYPPFSLLQNADLVNIPSPDK
ncbi:MAG: ABC transporter substrate-binding protein [Alphaproteobacteria bacterium]|nr:ABC transporter substrate-binding protein [Alphaproteobacteria bacterium]